MRQALLYLASYYLVNLELVLTLMFATMLAVSAAVARRRHARHEARCATGREVLARAITMGNDGMAGAAAFAKLPWDVQQELVHEFGGSLTGGALERLAELGVRTGIAQRAEAGCGSRWWWRRLRGARVLTALDIDCAAMRRLLRDRSGTVRAQAIVWAAGRDDEAVIDELVALLADPERLCRFTVQDSLLRLGRPAARVLARHLANPEWVGLADGLFVARGLAQPELLAPAIALASHRNEDVRARAAAVLGVLGGDEAVALLEQQLTDPSMDVRAAAARALGDLGAWTSSPTLVKLLGDTAYPVRRESALALRRMGGVGTLSLRRALHDENPFAADMAKQVLDLPESIYHRVTA